MAAAGTNPLADIDWNSPDINALLSNLFGGSAPSSSTSPAPALTSGFPPSTGFPPSATPRPSSTFAYPPPAAADPKTAINSTAPPTASFLPSASGSAMRSTSPEDTFDSPSSSEDEHTTKQSIKGATKRKSKASAAGGGAAGSHGATGVEGKKGRTGSGASGKNDEGRKSSSEPKDDSKVNKRKEQNRAAQRAFRERKEKHVKDLEDKVAELAAMSEGQKNENENLRDLLSRLQKENVMLKQQAFTFSLPSGLGNPSSVPSNATKPLSPPASLKDTASNSNASSSPESSASSADSPAIQPVPHAAPSSRSASSSTPWSFGSTPSSDESPASLFGMVPGPDTPPSTLSFSSAGFNAFTAPNAADLRQPEETEMKPPAPSPVSFAFSPGDFFPPPSPAPIQQQQQQPTSPFQMLATNPLFTSFHPSTPGYSLGNAIASPPSSQLTDLFPNGFDDFLKYSSTLSGSGGSGLTPGAATSPADLALSPDLMSLLNYPSSTGGDSGANGPDGGNTTASGASPVSSLTSPPSSMGASPASGNNNGGMIECGGIESSRCPSTKEEFVAIAAARPDATFGGAPSSASPDEVMAAAAAAAVAGGSDEVVEACGDGLVRDANYVPTWARADPKERDAFFRNHIMLSADPTAKNVQLHQLWKQITSTPGYTPESFDLDGLCNEMKCKARCDGSGPVLDEQEAKQILEEVPYRIRSNPMFGQWPTK